MGRSARFSAELWCVADGTWRFVTLPDHLSEVVRFESGPPRGFGSVRVEVAIGGTTWRTSVFPSAGGGPYVLPVKASVRRAENLDDGDLVAVSLRILDNGNGRPDRSPTGRLGTDQLQPLVEPQPSQM